LIGSDEANLPHPILLEFPVFFEGHRPFFIDVEPHPLAPQADAFSHRFDLGRPAEERINLDSFLRFISFPFHGNESAWMKWKE
jgi:hypothetical protein